MSNPLVHAERAAQKWGGAPDDYLAIHQFFDSTKAHLADNRHRLILHNSFGIAVAEQVSAGDLELRWGGASSCGTSGFSMFWKTWALSRLSPSA
jgi:hypothetical protein